jgi:hypothetical protein
MVNKTNFGKKVIGKILGDKTGRNRTEVVLSSKKKCDLCGDLAEYDGKTKSGPWAYMCKECMMRHGTGMGTGKGQKLMYK